MRFTAIAVLVSLSALMGGCVANTGSKDGKTASKGPGIHQACVQTWCEECTSSTDSDCSSCWDTCDTIDPSFAAECASACGDICTPSSACDDMCQNDSCEQTGFKLALPDKSDAKLKQACEADSQHVLDCNYIPPDCDAISRAMIPAEASFYECDKGKSCGDMSCPDAEPPSGRTIDYLCKACKDQTQCTDEKPFLESVEANLVPSMQDALYSCLYQSSCSDAWDCVDTFVDTLFPGYKSDFGQ